jgi:hypothetical protein
MILHLKELVATSQQREGSIQQQHSWNTERFLKPSPFKKNSTLLSSPEESIQD